MHLDAGALTDFARGCAVLGSGGGGAVAATYAVAEYAIEECGPVRVVSPATLDADALVMPLSTLGTSAVAAERIGGRGEPARLRDYVERVHGRPVAAVMSGEIGGLNGCLAVAWAARLGLPLLDADSMGRAFPRMDQNVLELAGVRPGPAVLADERGRTLVVDRVDGVHYELLARAAVDVLGGRAIASDYPLTAGQAAAHAVQGTVTQAVCIGRRLAETVDGSSGTHSAATPTGPAGPRGPGAPPMSPAHQARSDAASRLPVSRLTAKVSSVQRMTHADGGGTIEVLLEGIDTDTGRLVLVEARSEFVVALEDGRPLALVPDVIALVDVATGEPVPAEEVRYGLRVRLLTLPSAPVWYTPEGLRLAGPEAFGLHGLGAVPHQGSAAGNPSAGTPGAAA
ncbi:DUF917 domain-containing protein [Streptomyces sp. NPDC047725]|uniref:DUF917 domain-containing protein n=1 Tax=Streptomyces sp. NPDC047725 TaxID=3365487 RepID=UPI0037240A99